VLASSCFEVSAAADVATKRKAFHEDDVDVDKVVPTKDRSMNENGRVDANVNDLGKSDRLFVPDNRTVSAKKSPRRHHRHQLIQVAPFG
jgi:hypothetical protein